MTTHVNQAQPSFTVCIPTYYGGQSLVRAVESIRQSTGVATFRIIVAVDGNPLADEIATQLRHLGVEIAFSEQRGGQVARIKQMLAMVTTELTILTQDDIVFDPAALGHILNALADKRVSMVGVRVAAMSATTLLESVVEVGVRLTRHVGRLWKGADNYLLASGRCLAFRTAHLHQFELPESVINSDAYLYFENRRRGEGFRYIDEAIVYNRSPLRLHEHVKQAKKFEYSPLEMARHFGPEVADELRIPLWQLMRAVIGEAWRKPVMVVLYSGLHLYTKLQKNPFIGSQTGTWETDVSTKRVT